MKKIIAMLVLLTSLSRADVIPAALFDCEVSDTSTANAFDWNLIRAEARYLDVTYYQYGTNANLTGATNVALYLKASSSTNRYMITGYLLNASNGQARVLWPTSNAVPAATYSAEFGLSQSNNVNIAARGKIRVVDGTGSTPATMPPWYELKGLGTNDVTAGTGATVAQIGGGMIQISATGDTNAIAASLIDHQGLTGTSVHGLGTASLSNTGDFQAPIAGTVLTNGANVSALVNDANYADVDVYNEFATSNKFSGRVYLRGTGIRFIDAGSIVSFGEAGDIQWKDDEDQIAFASATSSRDIYTSDGATPALQISATAGSLLALPWKVTSNAVSGTDIVNYQTMTNHPIIKSVAGFTNAPATWSDTWKTLELAMIDGQTLQLGQEQVVVVRNTSGYTITNGTVCKTVSGAGIYSGVELADASDAWLGSLSTIGLATQDITNNAIGKITTLGNVNDINTTALEEGSNVWLHATIKGALTMAIPTDTTKHQPLIGMCLRKNANDGRILVEVQKTPHADDIGALPTAGGSMTGNINLNGNSVTNGSFVGNGSGLTNLPASTTPVISTPAQIGFAASNNIVITTNNQYFAFTNAGSLWAADPALVLSNENCTLLVTLEKGTNSLTLSSYGCITNGTGSILDITVTNSGPTVLVYHMPITMTNVTKHLWGVSKIR